MLDRLSEALTAAGVPIERVDGRVGAPLIVYQARATDAHRSVATAIVAGFNWSAATDAAWRAARAATVAKAQAAPLMSSATDPTVVAIRNALRVVMTAIAADRASLIGLIRDYNRRFGASLAEPPAVRPMRDVMAAVAAAIAAETDPEA